MKPKDLQKFRKIQLQKSLKKGLRVDIAKAREILGIPHKGFQEEKSAFAWRNDLPIPIPQIIMKNQVTASPLEEKELDTWLKKSLQKQGKTNSILLDVITKTSCKKYELGDEWVETLEQLFLYGEGSDSIKLPKAFTFEKSRERKDEEEKIVIVPSSDTTSSDFKETDFANAYRTARRQIKIESVLRKNKTYKVLRRHTGKTGQIDPVTKLVGRQPPWPWMETLHETNGFLQFFHDSDKRRYASLIARLDKVYNKLAAEVVKRTSHLSRLQKKYSDQVERGEITVEKAQKRYEDNVEVLYENFWSKEDKKIAGKALASAEKETQRIEKSLKKDIKRVVSSIPQRKRAKFA